MDRPQAVSCLEALMVDRPQASLRTEALMDRPHASSRSEALRNRPHASSRRCE